MNGVMRTADTRVVSTRVVWAKANQSIANLQQITGVFKEDKQEFIARDW